MPNIFCGAGKKSLDVLEIISYHTHMKTLTLLYELIIVAVIAMPAIPQFAKYGWKAFSLFFGNL